MADMQQVGQMVGKFIPSASSVFGFMIWAVAILIIASVCGYFIYREFKKRKFPDSVVLWKSYGGHSVPMFNFKGGPINVSKSGDQLYRTNKGKHLPKPKLYVKEKLVYYYEGKDGEWINFIPTDIDLKRKEMGAFFVHEDMRLGRINVGDILEKQLKKKNFWDKWKDTIMALIFILLITVCLVIMFAKLIDVIKQLGEMVTAVNNLAGSIAKMSEGVVRQTEYLEKIRGSGLSPVNITQ